MSVKKSVQLKSDSAAGKKAPRASWARRIVLVVLIGVNVVLFTILGDVIYSMSANKSPRFFNWGFAAKPASSVVAVINGHKIKMKEIRAFVKGVPQLAELPFDMIYPRVLETYVNSKVMLAAAEKAGIDSDPQVKKAVQAAKEQIMAQAYLIKKLEASVTPEQLKAAYEYEMTQYKPEEEVHARHILVKTLKEANDVVIQLNAGADFEALADKKSIDKNSAGGDLGYFTRNMMIPEFSAPVFGLRVGKISAPIKTPFGYHVVQVEDKRMTTAPSFEEIQDALRQSLMEQNAPKVIAEERAKMRVKINMPALPK